MLLSSLGVAEEQQQSFSPNHYISLVFQVFCSFSSTMDAKAQLAQQKKRKSLKRQRKREEHAPKRPRLADAVTKKPKSPDFLVNSFQLGGKSWQSSNVQKIIHSKSAAAFLTQKIEENLASSKELTFSPSFLLSVACRSLQNPLLSAYHNSPGCEGASQTLHDKRAAGP